MNANSNAPVAPISRGTFENPGSGEQQNQQQFPWQNGSQPAHVQSLPSEASARQTIEAR